MTKKKDMAKKAKAGLDNYLQMVEQRKQRAEAEYQATGQVTGVSKADLVELGLGSVLVAGGFYTLKPAAGCSEKVFKEYKNQLDEASTKRLEAETALTEAEIDEGKKANKVNAAKKELDGITQKREDLDNKVKAAKQKVSELENNSEIETKKAQVEKLRNSAQVGKATTVEEYKAKLTEIEANIQSITNEPVKFQSNNVYKSKEAAEKALDGVKGKKAPKWYQYSVVKTGSNQFKIALTVSPGSQERLVNRKTTINKLITATEELSVLEEKQAKYTKSTLNNEKELLEKLEDQQKNAVEKEKAATKKHTDAMAEYEKAKGTRNTAIETYKKALEAENKIVNKKPAGVIIEAPTAKNPELEPKPAKTATKAPYKQRVAGGKGVKSWRAAGGAAATVLGMYFILDAINPDLLTNESSGNKTAEVQSDQTVHYSGSISQEDKKYFEDEALVAKYKVALAYYTLYGMGGYSPEGVRDKIGAIEANLAQSERYEDIAELEFRKALIAEFDDAERAAELHNFYKFMKGGFGNAKKVLDHFQKHGGPDRTGKYQSAEYWKVEAEKIYNGGYSMDGLTGVCSDLLKHYDPKTGTVKDQNAPTVPAPEKNPNGKEQPSSENAENNKEPAPRQSRGNAIRQKRPNAGRIPGVRQEQTPPQPQANASNALRGAGQVVSDQTTEMDQTRTSGGRGGMA